MKPIKFESEVREVKQLSPSVKSFLLTIPDQFSFEPGQFVTLFVNIGNTIERRSYSIASSVGQKGFIEVCVDSVEHGRVSPHVHAFQKGQKVTVQGPLGVFILKPDAKEKENVFIATGTGITPFVSMIPYLLEQTKKKVILLAGYKHEDEILYDDIFRSLTKKYNNFEYHTIISRPKNSTYIRETGYVQALLEKRVPVDFAGDFYLCGLFNMIKDVGKLLVERKINKERIIFERYD